MAKELQLLYYSGGDVDPFRHVIVNAMPVDAPDPEIIIAGRALTLQGSSLASKRAIGNSIERFMTEGIILDAK